MDATETTAPRLAMRWGRAARATRKAPVRLTDTMVDQSPGDRSTTPPGAITPAFSTSPSSRPNSPAAASTVRATCCGSRTSQTRSSAPVCAATARRAPARRPQMATRLPAAASVRATAAPIPLPPPVTRTACGRVTACSHGSLRAQVGQLRARGPPGFQHEGGGETDHEQAEREPWRVDGRGGDLVERPEDGGGGNQDADHRRQDDPGPALGVREAAQRADRHEQVDHD